MNMHSPWLSAAQNSITVQYRGLKHYFTVVHIIWQTWIRREIKIYGEHKIEKCKTLRDYSYSQLSSSYKIWTKTGSFYKGLLIPFSTILSMFFPRNRKVRHTT